jgi:phosphoserine phosphatase
MWIFLFKTICLEDRRLVCFDMDSTLIQTRSIDELADLSVGEQVRSITEAAMNEMILKKVLRSAWLC